MDRPDMAKERHMYQAAPVRDARRIVLALLGAIAFAGCSAGATPSQQPSAGATASTASEGPATTSPSATDTTYEGWINTVASTDPVKIRIVHQFDPNNAAEHHQETMDHATAEWKKRYPNGDISWELVGWGDIDQKTPAFVQAGDNVDITYNWGGATENWCKAGFLVPLERYMPAWWTGSRVADAFKTPANDLCSDGTLVMAAWSVESQFFLLRKDILAQAGVDPATLSTCDGFIAGMQAIADKTSVKTPVALSLGSDWTTMDDVSFLWLGGGVSFGDFRADGSEKDAWIKSATFARDLAKLGPEAQLSWQHDDVNQAYVSGIVAGIQAGSWYFDTMTALDPSGKTFRDESTLLVPYPSCSSDMAPFHSSNYTGQYMLTTSPEANRQPAADLMAILSDTKTVFLKSDSTIPPTIGWTAADRLLTAHNKDVGWWWAQLDSVHKAKKVDYPGFPARDQITAAAYPYVIEMAQGKITPEQLYDKVRAVALPLIQAAR